jgi:hypothetical protein
MFNEANIVEAFLRDQLSGDIHQVVVPFGSIFRQNFQFNNNLDSYMTSTPNLQNQLAGDVYP